MQTDAEVVRAVLKGQKQAFAVLVKRYERSVRAVAINVLGDHESVQDTAQEAFIRAYEHLSGLRAGTRILIQRQWSSHAGCCSSLKAKTWILMPRVYG